MNVFIIGTHKTGKSTKAVKLVQKTGAKKIWLIAANPYQRDDKTGKLTFPEHFKRTDESILLPHRISERQNSAIVIDDAPSIRRKWKEIESIFATPRQNAVDMYLITHDPSLIPTQLAGYCNMAFIFRSANNIPPYSSWGMKSQMKEAAEIIRTRGTSHSFYVINIIEGRIIAFVA